MASLCSSRSAFAGTRTAFSGVAPRPAARASVVVQASKVCELTGKHRNKANSICFSNKKHRVFQEPNLQRKKLFWAHGQRWVSLRLCTKAIKTVEKNGLDAMAAEAGIDLWSLPFQDARPERLQYLAENKGKVPVAVNPRCEGVRDRLGRPCAGGGAIGGGAALSLTKPAKGRWGGGPGRLAAGGSGMGQLVAWQCSQLISDSGEGTRTACMRATAPCMQSRNWPAARAHGAAGQAAALPRSHHEAGTKRSMQRIAEERLDWAQAACRMQTARGLGWPCAQAPLAHWLTLLVSSVPSAGR